jgi:hypothetical protein
LPTVDVSQEQLARDLDRDLSRDLERDLDRDLDRDLNRDLDRDLDRDLVRYLALCAPGRKRNMSIKDGEIFICWNFLHLEILHKGFVIWGGGGFSYVKDFVQAL